MQVAAPAGGRRGTQRNANSESGGARARAAARSAPRYGCPSFGGTRRDRRFRRARARLALARAIRSGPALLRAYVFFDRPGRERVGFDRAGVRVRRTTPTSAARWGGRQATRTGGHRIGALWRGADPADIFRSRRRDGGSVSSRPGLGAVRRRVVLERSWSPACGYAVGATALASSYSTCFMCRSALHARRAGVCP